MFWNDVKEGLPAYDTRVLVVTEYGHFAVATRSEYAMDDDNWYILDLGYRGEWENDEFGKIRYWCNIPDSPIPERLA